MSSILKSAAFHEFGHVVIYYFVGSLCDSMVIENSGDGVTKINYGTDHLLITASGLSTD